jgi:hypothetical protein
MDDTYADSCRRGSQHARQTSPGAPLEWHPGADWTDCPQCNPFASWNRCVAPISAGSYNGPCNRLTSDGRPYCNDHRVFGPSVLQRNRYRVVGGKRW